MSAFWGGVLFAIALVATLFAVAYYLRDALQHPFDLGDD